MYAVQAFLVTFFFVFLMYHMRKYHRYEYNRVKKQMVFYFFLVLINLILYIAFLESDQETR